MDLSGSLSTLGFTPSLANAISGQYNNVPTNQFLPVNINPSQFAAPDFTSLFNTAYNQLAPYYSQLLAEAGGDVNRAIGYLQRDYDTGVRYTNTASQQVIQSIQDTLANNLAQQGITDTQDFNNAIDTLNKRGIALTQDPATGKLMSPQMGDTNPQNMGQAGTEAGQLANQQSLRREALNRSAQQQIASNKLTTQYQLDTAQSANQQNIENQTRNLQKTQEQLGQQRQQEALNMAGQQQSLGLQQQQVQTNANILNAQYGRYSQTPASQRIGNIPSGVGNTFSYG